MASEQRARLEVRRLLDSAATLCSCRVQSQQEVAFKCFSFSTQEIQTAMTKLSKSQAQMIKEREMFSEVTAEMEKALKQAETLLL